MKKLLTLSIAALTLSASSASAQWSEGGAFTKGSSVIQVGYGFISPYKTVFKLASALGQVESKFSGIGPIGLTYEYGVGEKFSLGIGLAYGNMKNEVTVKGGSSTGSDWIYSYNLTQMSALVRGAYHFGSFEKFDPYIGLGLGYANMKMSVTSNDANSIPATLTIPGAFMYSGFLGARYYFTQNIGAFAEVGYLAGSFIQVGLAFKFGGESY